MEKLVSAAFFHPETYSRFYPPMGGSAVSFSAGEGGSFLILPGFCDVHVHFREPGFSYKETIATGSAAAARGGYTAVCAMPNLDPVPDGADTLAAERAIIDRDAVVPVYPYGAITKGEKGEALADMEAMAPDVIAFSDDGRGVQSESMMRSAMEKARRLRKIIAAHCEVNELLHGGYIHDGAYAAAHGHRGISGESEWRQIKRDLSLAKETSCAYHVCHISTAESVELIRAAKAQGVDVTCETGPHYLTLDEDDLQEDGRFKMNPPLRTRRDREALIEGLLDGTIDMIATDHAPHSVEEKSRGLEKSAMGIVGLETTFPVLYTRLVRPGILPLERLVRAMVLAPRERFCIPAGEEWCLWEMDRPYTVDPGEFYSMGRSTPFAGWEVYGRCRFTVREGYVAYQSRD